MKYFIIIFAIILLAIAYVGLTELRDVNRVQQSTIDGLRLRNKTEKDSLEEQLSLTRENFSRQIDSVVFAHKETLKAKEQSQREIKILKGILFVTHSDSSRTATLKELYKSYTP